MSKLSEKCDLSTVLGRQAFIENEESSLYGGKNEDGEDVAVMMSQGIGMTITTFQQNGWVRKNDYGADGYIECEYSDGKWD